MTINWEQYERTGGFCYTAFYQCKLCGESLWACELHEDEYKQLREHDCGEVIYAVPI